MKPLELAIYTTGVVVAGLALLAPQPVWRFDVGVVPAWSFTAMVSVALCTALVLRQRRDNAVSGGAAESRNVHPSWTTQILTFAVAAACLWLVRCERIYGDAQAITGFITEGVLFHKREPLSPTLFLLAHRSVGAALGWEPRLTIQVVNTLAGALGVVALVGIARRITGPGHVGRAATAVLVSSGAIQLFAGYVENYTIPTVCMLYSIAFGLDALAGRREFSAAVGLWVASCMFHLGGLVLLPAMAWLVWQAWRGDTRGSMLRLLSVTILPALVLYALMHYLGFHRSEERGFGGGDGLMFVPVFEQSGMSQYLLFRPAHLLAIANQQLLVAPLGIVMFVAGVICALRRRPWRALIAEPSGSALVFLGLVAGGFLCLTLIWNPDLGPLRDWDLFGPVGFYLNIFGVALIAHQLRSSPRAMIAMLWFVAAVNLSRALPFVLHNAGA
jgi:hypothetical protein